MSVVGEVGICVYIRSWWQDVSMEHGSRAERGMRRFICVRSLMIRVYKCSVRSADEQIKLHLGTWHRIEQIDPVNPGNMDLTASELGDIDTNVANL